MQRGDRHRLHRRYCCLVLAGPGARDYILAAVPSGAAQEARYPAGTLGDIQAVTFRYIITVHWHTSARSLRMASLRQSERKNEQIPLFFPLLA